MDNKPISNTLQKTKNFRENQESIIKTISKKCNQTTFVENIQSDENQIKHFNLPDGTHVYSISASNSSKPSRLISSTELPKIRYFANHWNPMLVPDEDLSKVHGTYIYVNPNSVCYTSFFNGKTLFEAGYNFNFDDSNKTNFFCNFGRSHFGKTFNELPNNVNNIMELLGHGFNHYGCNYPKLVANYKTARNVLLHLENSTVNQLNSDINEKSTTPKIEKFNNCNDNVLKSQTKTSSFEVIESKSTKSDSEVSYQNMESKTEKQLFYDSLKVDDLELKSNKSISIADEINNTKQSKFKNKLFGLLKKHSTPDRDKE